MKSEAFWFAIVGIASACAGHNYQTFAISSISTKQYGYEVDITHAFIRAFLLRIF